MFAANVSIGKDVQIVGKKYIAIGRGSCIGNGSWLNVCVSGSNIRMKIGKCVLVGRQSVISTGGYLEIGDYCLFAPRVYVSDTDHVFTDPAKPVIEQGATLNRTLIIEENCWLGINAVVSGNITVGRGSIIAANSVVLKDVPPFSVAAGAPAIVVKMYDFNTKSWERVRNEDDIGRIRNSNNKSGLPTREELQKVLDSNCKISRVNVSFGGNRFL
ncbi:MAG: acyltransferase [Candidatus Omnitrophica bacterium]|jgi:acetyltransferase-like isoleucine patch superfamily enzyme|nr:acyltransferase [Candidatus Omnitrophota bacterium]